MKTGEQLKLIGLARARKKHSTALDAARAWARALAAYGPITIDEVKAKLEQLSVSDLKNAAGAVFDGPEWECCGWRPSTRPSAHYRAVRVWRLKDPEYDQKYPMFTTGTATLTIRKGRD
jgi:hypothetical protein